MSDSAPGLLASLRQLAASLVELAQVRLELLGTELEHEKLRVTSALMWAGIAAVLLAIGVLLLVLLIVLLLWDGHRFAALAVLGAICLGGAVLSWRVARARWLAPRGAFAASIDELARDRAALAPQPPGEERR